MSQALEDIAAERRRQIEGEGFTPERDDSYRDGSLAAAASQYLNLVAAAAEMNGAPEAAYQAVSPPKDWPWDPRWWKPNSPRRDLVKAAALIVAEIERMDRAAERARG